MEWGGVVLGLGLFIIGTAAVDVVVFGGEIFFFSFFFFCYYYYHQLAVPMPACWASRGKLALEWKGLTLRFHQIGLITWTQGTEIECVGEIFCVSFEKSLSLVLASICKKTNLETRSSGVSPVDLNPLD